jgi:predicted alpha/beta-hydrolase family hydrolase
VPAKSRARDIVDLPTPTGLAQAVLEVPTSTPAGLLVLGHGAGGGIDAPDLKAMTAAARDAGLVVARVRQPYSVAGRRAPAPAPQLDAAWTAVVEQLATALRADYPRLPIAVGGRSSGARVACRTAVATGAVGVIALAFPLHPPGHPEKSRAPELAAGVPLLVLQGGRDPFGGPAEFPPGTNIHEVTGADHRLVGPHLGAAIAAAVSWLAPLLTTAARPRSRSRG